MSTKSMNECVSILEEHGVKATANRILIVSTMLDAGRPLSLTELETELETVDKSIISRTLALLKSKRLVHVVGAADDGSRYEICHCPEAEEDNDEHVHFHCEVCHRTFCFENVPIPHVEYPSGFSVHSLNYVASGICPECASKHRED